MHQLSFEDQSYYDRTRKTRKQLFLETMGRVLPWDTLLDEIRPHYPTGTRGRPPIRLEVMLRIHFMQLWFGLSDPGMEDALCDNVSIRIFAGLASDEAPDETTICKFRHLLERHQVASKVLELSTATLKAHGLFVQQGSIVDATIISAPSSTKNRDHQRDPEMKSTRKGNAWHFGMKMHIGTDTEGHVHSVVATAANVHDSTVMSDCLHGDEKEIYGDKAYVSSTHQKEAEARGVQWKVLRKGTRDRALDEADQAYNRECNRTRAKVEHPFGIVKHLWGYRKTRYRGLDKNASRLTLMFALANFYMARKQLITYMG